MTTAALKMMNSQRPVPLPQWWEQSDASLGGGDQLTMSPGLRLAGEARGKVGEGGWRQGAQQQLQQAVEGAEVGRAMVAGGWLGSKRIGEGAGGAGLQLDQNKSNT